MNTPVDLGSPSGRQKRIAILASAALVLAAG